MKLCDVHNGASSGRSRRRGSRATTLGGVEALGLVSIDKARRDLGWDQAFRDP
jgi:hypothetical protein